MPPLLQILGEDHEPGGLLGGLRRWDGDRYLAKAYRCDIRGSGVILSGLSLHFAEVTFSYVLATF